MVSYRQSKELMGTGISAHGNRRLMARRAAKVPTALPLVICIRRMVQVRLTTELSYSRPAVMTPVTFDNRSTTAPPAERQAGPHRPIREHGLGGREALSWAGFGRPGVKAKVR